MQEVRVLSSETNDLIQVTPSSALRATTARQSSAPPFWTGTCSPSGKVRCTTYRGISVLLFRRLLDTPPSYVRGAASASGEPPTLDGCATYLGTREGWRLGHPPIRE